jgi:hypothetical protein
MGLYTPSTTLNSRLQTLKSGLNIVTSHSIIQTQSQALLSTDMNIIVKREIRIPHNKQSSNHNINTGGILQKRNRRKQRRNQRRKTSSSIAKMRLCFPPHHSLLQRAFLHRRRKVKRKEREKRNGKGENNLVLYKRCSTMHKVALVLLT